MATCVFVASGLEFPMDAYLQQSPFKAKTVFYKGTIPQLNNPERAPRPDSGFVVVVGDDSESTVRSQLDIAFQFLIRHEGELRRLRIFGVDNMLFDFGVIRRHALDQTEYFPPELIQAMARLGMGLSTSTVLLPHR